MMKIKEGLDLTKILNIQKYDPRPENVDPVKVNKHNAFVNYMLGYHLFRKVYRLVMPGKTKGNFPTFIPKTDETRLQNSPALVRKNVGKEFYFTEKLDGSSATFFYNNKLAGKKWGMFKKDLGDGFGVCSRNLRLVHKNSSYWWHIALNNQMEENLKGMVSFLGFNLALQGEIIGPGIQENKYKRDRLEFYCYSIFNINTQKYVPYYDKIEICNKFDIPTVPRVKIFTLTDEHDVPFFVELSKRKSVLNKDVLAEGVVGRSVEDDAVSFKVINPEWLLKYKE
ncbi:hypothetical protein JZU46_06175 [bacterium]|nr:hypothetical protein [bacterium]